MRSWPHYIQTIIEVFTDPFSTADTQLAVALSIIKQYVSKSNVNMRYQDQKTVLMLLSCIDESAELLRYIILTGATIDAKDDEGLTALMYASYFLNTKAIALLVEQGADLNYLDQQEQSALMYAVARHGTVAIWSKKLLFTAVYLLKESDQSILSRVCFDTSLREEPLVVHSVKAVTSIELTAILLSFGANPNYQMNHQSMLTRSASVEDHQMSQLLLRYGADPGKVYEMLSSLNELESTPPEVYRQWKLFSHLKPAPALFGNEEDRYSPNQIDAYHQDCQLYLPTILGYVESGIQKALDTAYQIILAVESFKNDLEVWRLDLPILPPEVWRMIVAHLVVEMRIYPSSDTLRILPGKTKRIALQDVNIMHPNISSKVNYALSPSRFFTTIVSKSSPRFLRAQGR